MEIHAGQRLGAYEILRKLGEGGMGAVYLALDSRLGRKIALKVLLPEVAQRPEALARFEREARSVAALNHPAIVTLHSVEEADGVHFLTMEHVEGVTLGQAIPPDGLPFDRFLSLALALTEALAAAHEQGIIHRDLKPGNIMVTGDGRVKILDFGLAKLRPGPRPSEAPTELGLRATEWLSEGGRVLGTVPYMAPEQLQGRPADERSDLFSLGIVLFQMATGRRPFAGATANEIAASILKDRPPLPSTVGSEVPDGLDAILARCLEKAAPRRYGAAKELRRDLAALAATIRTSEEDGSAVPRPRPGPGARRRLWGVAVGLAVALGVGWGVAHYRPWAAGRHSADLTSLKVRDLEAQARTLMASFGDDQALALATERWEEALRLQPEDPHLTAGLALARMLVAWNSSPTPGLLDRAQAEAEGALARDAGATDAYLALSFTYLLRGLVDSAEQMSAKAAALMPRDPFVLQARARFLIDVYGRFRAALDLAQRAVEIDPTHYPAWFQLGSAELELEAYDEADKAFDRSVELRPDFLAGHLGRIQVRLARGAYTEAVELSDRALELNANSPQVRFFRGMARHALGDATAALADFEMAARINPQHPIASDALACKGLELRALGREAEAEAALVAAERGFKRYAGRWMSALGLAEVAAVRGEAEEAFAWLDRAVEGGLRSVPRVETNPPLEVLRGDSRFEALFRRIRALRDQENPPETP